MTHLACLSAALSLLISVADGDEPAPSSVERVVFLGDSITYAGGFVEDLEAYARLHHQGLRREFLNLGLPSETVSGLSEPGHAGGAFPRPDLHERLDRVLEATRPDLIVACYGMNDGIYHPFSEERFEAFRLGLGRLREQADAFGAEVLHVTPPVFDPEPIHERTLPAGLPEYRQPYEGYDEVLGRYSEWLLSRRAEGWEVVDVHAPLSRFLAERRREEPAFRLADDGVHLGPTGHWLMARELLDHWGLLAPGDATREDPVEVFEGVPNGTAVRSLIRQKHQLLKDSWLTATGHQRPGMEQGVPLVEAVRQAREIDDQIDALLSDEP